MLEYDMLAHPPSQVAAAAAVVAKLHFHDVADLAALPLVTAYSLADLRPAMRRLLALQSAAFAARDYSSPYVERGWRGGEGCARCLPGAHGACRLAGAGWRVHCVWARRPRALQQPSPATWMLTAPHCLPLSLPFLLSSALLQYETSTAPTSGSAPRPPRPLPASPPSAARGTRMRRRRRRRKPRCPPPPRAANTAPAAASEGPRGGARRPAPVPADARQQRSAAAAAD